jgi:hypothetical protein
MATHDEKYLSKVSDKKITWPSWLGIRHDAEIITLEKLNCLESPVGEEGEGGMDQKREAAP